MSTPKQVRRIAMYGGSWLHVEFCLSPAYHTFTDSDERYFETGLRIKLRRIT